MIIIKFKRRKVETNIQQIVQLMHCVDLSVWHREMCYNRKVVISNIKATTGYHKREALRIAKLMPCWKPATQGGKAIDSGYTLMINFQ